MNVTVSIDEGIASILLHNPPLNILSNAVKRDIKETFQSLASNKNVRVILFETAGEHFCCGADLKEFPDRIKQNKAKEAWIEGHGMLQAIMNVPQPTIVCVKGNALGGGAELASAFDIRLFADDVSFGYPEVSRAVFPGNGGLERFMELSGESHAAFLFLTGERISASEALRIGMANKVVETEKLELEGKKTAQLLASYSNVTIQTIKRVIQDCLKGDQFFRKGMNDFASLHETEDVKESITAFFEKRKPVYQHK
ncbi:enoyl-CoA hydratase/isomerase family protein [Domibacillus sp. DTU_2020_1001157_1_SI_ALB_TIR_016]|uniref:enoyl-CoA hydratase/isomerase family protein n=1 Tax=Domibacillus sp. DTU_2020_1001157_1_SI_ALB_TIR_016 TaxID=3077789 RepID=UPI0028E2B9CB|nr:enoyl-CoA hydratase/isomerase family protein [Domibacillus sp. DTU_2020_1001157_1_SI_ALB_TIR_016]WNS79582.1 enoyl-CoA hydratase/isomerase family protein [Domibacillus sp. DTU_2020_1001157_1_SI_ALB_TIR_016]